jgi:xanthine dehydrogenase accessory factor
VLGYLADRGVPQEQLDRVRVPAGVDLGATSHREIAVAILAELVQLRAAGSLLPGQAGGPAKAAAALAVDPVCGMTVAADSSSHSLEHGGATYYFCRVACRAAFEKDPAAYVGQESAC